MYCSHCGKEIDDNATVCPECGKPVNSGMQKKIKVELNPLTAVGVVFSLIAFVSGILFVSWTFKNGGMTWLGELVAIPAFVGLGIGIYQRLSDKVDAKSKAASLVSICLSGFTVLYYFIGFIVLFA